MLETIEVSATFLASLAALALSAYSVSVAKKRNDHNDLKELTGTLATFSTKLETIENAVLGKPTLSEQVAVHDQKIKDHDRRIIALEQCRKENKL